MRLIATLAVALLGCTASKPTPESEPPSGSTVGPIEAEPDDGPAAVEAASYNQSVEIDGVRLGLRAEGCVLTAEWSSERGEQRLEHRFEFPAACGFASDESGGVRIVETDSGKAVMVESSRPLERDCETATRVVVVTPQGPRVSKAAQRVAMCLPFAWDEMMFHVLASEAVEFGTASVDP